jgi:cell division protein FtsW (lipid II flippase)
MIIPLNLIIILTVVFGLYMMKSWKFDVEKCKTPSTSSPKKEMMWNAIELVIFMCLVVLMVLSHRSEPYGTKMILYCISLVAFGVMKFIIVKNKDKVNKLIDEDLNNLDYSKIENINLL